LNFGPPVGQFPISANSRTVNLMSTSTVIDAICLAPDIDPATDTVAASVPSVADFKVGLASIDASPSEILSKIKRLMSHSEEDGVEIERRVQRSGTIRATVVAMPEDSHHALVSILVATGFKF